MAADCGGLALMLEARRPRRVFSKSATRASQLQNKNLKLRASVQPTPRSLSVPIPISAVNFLPMRELLTPPFVRSTLRPTDQFRRRVSDSRIECRETHPVFTRYLRQISVRGLCRDR